ncbi:hypothetical protein E2320_003501 [Naja naja]|nr:hypothetical protein E2320_003501 [Naja naja]
MGDLGSRIVALLFAISTAVSGQAIVTQEHQFLSIKEGDSIHLKCSYLEAATNLQWYKQYPGGQPEFMIILYSSNTETKDNFEMTLNTNNKTTSLYLKNTQLKDSAVYFCAWSTVLQRHLLAVIKSGGNHREEIELPTGGPSFKSEPRIAYLSRLIWENKFGIPSEIPSCLGPHKMFDKVFKS